MDDVDALLAELEAEEITPGPLPSGVNPWDMPKYDQRTMARQRYQREIETHGIDVTCEVCGHEWRTHPINRGRVFYCSHRCNLAAWRKRKKEGATRPLIERPWKPWEKGKKNADQ